MRFWKGLFGGNQSPKAEISIGAAVDFCCWVENGALENIAALLRSKPDLVSSRVSGGETPLHVAARVGCSDVVELLVAKKADVHAKDGNGETPLHLAAHYGNERWERCC